MNVVAPCFALLVAAASTGSVRASTPPDTARYPSEEALRAYAQGRLMEEEGDAGSALAAYYRALRADPAAAAAALRVSELAARAGSADRSLEFADRVLELRPGDPRALWLRGAALFNLGRQAESLEPLQRAARTDSGSVEYARGYARVAEALDRVPLVAEAYRRIVRLDDADGEAWFQLAAAECRLGDFAAAEVALVRARALEPRRPGIEFLDGWVEESTGRTKDAIESYRSHLERHPDDQVTRRRLVNVLVRERRDAEAYAMAREVSRAAPGDEEAREVEAELALRSGHVREGLALLAALRAAAPDDPERVMRSVAVLHRTNRSAEGAKLAEAWADDHAGDHRGALLASRARSLAGEIDRAVEHGRRAIALAPDSAVTHATLARVLTGAQRWRDAEAVLAAAVERFPEIPAFGLDLAFARERLGDIDGAERAARAVLARDPDHAGALNTLGYLLADHSRSLEEARALIARAVAQEPDNGAYVDSMGWVYYRLGRLEDARRELERAVALTRGDPVVREHLGDVYKDLKLLELAREQYRQALADDGGNDRLRTKLDATRK